MENNILTDEQSYDLVEAFGHNPSDYNQRVDHFSSEVLAGWSRHMHAIQKALADAGDIGAQARLELMFGEPDTVEYFDNLKAERAVAAAPPATNSPLVQKSLDDARASNDAAQKILDELEADALDREWEERCAESEARYQETQQGLRRPGFVPIGQLYPELYGKREDDGPGFLASTAAALLGVAAGYKASKAFRNR